IVAGPAGAAVLARPGAAPFGAAAKRAPLVWQDRADVTRDVVKFGAPDLSPRRSWNAHLLQGPMPRRILLAEDDDAARQMAERYLVAKGFEVDSVRDGAAVL